MTTMNDAIRARLRGDHADPEFVRRERTIRAAADAGFRDPADAWALTSHLAGEPEDLVEALADAKPHLVGPNGQMNRAVRSRGVRAVASPEPPAQRPIGSADAGNAGQRAAETAPDMNDAIRAARLGDTPEGLSADRTKREMYGGSE